MTYGREVSTVQGQGAMRIMPDLSNKPAAFGTDQQRRVWQLYDAGRLTANQATTKLLRLNLDQSREKVYGSRITRYVRGDFTV